MIPLPPQDPSLAPIDVLLSSAAMCDVIQHSVPDFVNGELRAERCRPCYVRHAPGTSMIVKYELEYRLTHANSVANTVAFAAAYADDQAEARWREGRLDRLVRDVAAWHPDSARYGAGYVPELRTLVHLYPIDLELPALVRASSARRMKQVLSELAPVQFDQCRPELVHDRYRPAKSALFRYRLAGDLSLGIYGKMKSSHRGERLHRLGCALEAAGIAAPRPLGYCRNLRMVLEAEARGTRLTDLQGTAEYMEWMRPVAQALVRLQSTVIPDLPVSPPGKGIDAVLAAGRAIGTIVPRLRADAAQLAIDIVRSVEDVQAPTGTIHGDFYDEQILVSDDRGPNVVLLDFEEARVGNPLEDVGNFLAHLTILPTEQCEFAGRARAQFLKEYGALRRPGIEHALLFEAAALLPLAFNPFRRLDSQWPLAVERKMRLAAERFDEYCSGHRRPLTAR